MAGELGEVNGALQINSGDQELDRKIEEWLSLDKVGLLKRNYEAQAI